MYEFLILLGVPGALQALITPELTLGYDKVFLVEYFISHGGIILSGFYIGYLSSVIITTIGSFNLFYLSKNIYKKKFSNKFSKSINKINNIIKNQSYEILIIFRMLPINAPFFIQNISLSFLNISNIKYIIVTFIGLSPLIIILVLIGDTITHINSFKIFEFDKLEFNKIFFLIFFILIVLTIRIFYSYKKNKKKAL